jgi:hypothetical protein
MQHYKEVISTKKKITGGNAKFTYFTEGKNLLTNNKIYFTNPSFTKWRMATQP